MHTDVHDLKSKGIHPSYQRVRILGFLRTCSSEDFFRPKKLPKLYAQSQKKIDYHPTAEQIHACLVKEIPTLSKTTVYNTLKLLEEQKLIASVMIDQHGALRYDRYAEEHAHLLCNKCGELIDQVLSPSLKAQLSEFVGKEVQLNSWQLILRGTCATCN